MCHCASAPQYLNASRTWYLKYVQWRPVHIRYLATRNLEEELPKYFLGFLFLSLLTMSYQVRKHSN